MKNRNLKFLISGVVSILLSSTYVCFAQQETSGQSDFTYEKRHIEERKVTPYPALRQADVMYSRRIHRVLDSREKQNLGLKWKKNPFGKILLDAVKSKAEVASLTPYRSDSLSSFYSRAQLMDQITTSYTEEYAPNPIEAPNITRDTTRVDSMDYENINQYRIMEDWVFDKETGEFFPRIIAIAPLTMEKRGGIEVGLEPLFWLKWKELRKILVNEPMFNRHNDAAQLSYYDFFEQRLFSSYIVKEPNELEYDIKNLPKYDGDKFGALIRAKEIEEELFNFEHDLWQY